jgi:hypothetical protein
VYLKIKNIIKLFIPVILTPNYLRKNFNLIFNKKKTKHHFEFDNQLFNRSAYINKAIQKFKNCKYLEIGCGNNKVFNTIPLKIKNKFGVDPVIGGNFRMKSDDFFKKYPRYKFDIIFIDGLHDYKQCQTDCLNAISRIKKNGIILLHDLLPRSFFEERKPIYQPNWAGSWCGDVWKVAVELTSSKNLEFKIINIDHGIGILKIKKNFEYKKIDKLKNQGFAEYLEYKKKFTIIDAERGLDFIAQ